MLTIGAGLSSFTLAAGEPFILEVQLLKANGQAHDIDDTALVLSIYKTSNREIVEQVNGDRQQDANGNEFFRWAFPGTFSEDLYAVRDLRVEISRRFKDGRNVLGSGVLNVTSSAATVPSLSNGLIGDLAVRVTIKDAAVLGGAPDFSSAVVPVDNVDVTPTPTPSPTFTSLPSINPGSGTAGTTTFTATDGAVSNGAVSSRRWLLSGTSIGTATTVTPNAAGSLVLENTATGAGGTATASSGAVTVAASPTPTPTPAGFYANGASNAALKAAASRVTGGSGRGKVLFKGDSTTVGQGAGTGGQRLVGARSHRRPTALAALLTNAGLRSLDIGIVADNGVINGELLSAYDPRVTTNTWTRSFDQTFAGGGYLLVPDANGLPLQIAIAEIVDTLESVHYAYGNFAYNINLGGGNTTIVNTGATNGFGRGVYSTAAGSGKVAQLNTIATANGVAICSLRAYNSAVSALDFVVDASCGATAAQQAAANVGGTNWSGRDHLAYEAPDLTIINLGINDMLQNVSASASASSLDALITTAKLSGDVLLEVPHPIDPAQVDDAKQQALNAAVKQLAAARGVACLSFYDHFGSFASISPQLPDGVHGNAAFYASAAQAEAQAIAIMRA